MRVCACEWTTTTTKGNDNGSDRDNADVDHNNDYDDGHDELTPPWNMLNGTYCPRFC